VSYRDILIQTWPNLSCLAIIGHNIYIFIYLYIYIFDHILPHTFGHIYPYWVIIGYIGPYLAILDRNWPYLIILRQTRSFLLRFATIDHNWTYCNILRYTGFYSFIFAHTFLYLIIWATVSKSYSVTYGYSCQIEPHLAILCHIWPYSVIFDFIHLYSPILRQTWSY
jgi:hypothetical protein